ncbi:MAG TPA: phage major capsid protein [Micromonospora sp.]|nr:phage major capsid protein [Micromonospora sp.]
MAITAATTTSGFSGFLQADRAAAIFERASRMSVIQRLARQVPLGANGMEIPVVTGRMSAGWVSEAGQKPASAGTMSIKTITPKKLASIAVVSAEVVRANPGNYMNLLRDQIAEAFAIAFDNAAAHDAGPDGTSGAGPFSTYLDQTTKAVELGSSAASAGGIHADLNAALTLLVNDSKKLTGWALDDRVEPMLFGAVDTTGRPLYVDLPSDDTSAAVARPGRLLNRPSFLGEGLYYNTTADVYGYAGDWTQAAWGVVGGISYDVSTQATVTVNGSLVSLWENNLVAVRAEAEYGWLVNDTASFVKLVENT